MPLSIEGDPERDDPTRVISPAYQQLQFQTDGPKIIQALLVGQSGPHHFSAVFAMEEAGKPDHVLWPDGAFGGIYIGIDVADRCREPVDALASTYNVAATSSNLVGAPIRAFFSAAWDVGVKTGLTFVHSPRRAVAESYWLRLDAKAPRSRLSPAQHRTRRPVDFSTPGTGTRTSAR